MNKKKLTAILLTAAMAAQGGSYSALAAEFSDGTVLRDAAMVQEEQAEADVEMFTSEEQTTEEAELFSSGEMQAPEEFVYLDGVTYKYHPETASYCVIGVPCTGETIVLKSEISGKKVTEISEWLCGSPGEMDEWYNMAGNIIIPDTVTKIGEGAFSFGRATVINIPDTATEIGTRLFENHSNIRFVHFPGGARVFPAGLFGSCKKLEIIEIGQGVTEIAPGAMKGCGGLREVHIPGSVAAIGDDLFDKGVEPVIYGQRGSAAEAYAAACGLAFMEEGRNQGQDNENPEIDGVRYTFRKAEDSYIAVGFGAGIPEKVILPEEINGKKVTGIGDGAFRSCIGMREIYIPGTVKTIGKAAFESCGALEKVTMENGVETIGEQAFSSVWNLEELRLPDSVASIGRQCFYRCSFKKLQLPAGLKEISQEMFLCGTVESALVIPKGVTKVGSYAFSEFYGEAVRLPDSVKEIGEGAFEASTIEKVVVPGTVTRLEKGVFDSAEVNSLALGRGLKEISEKAFSGCKIEALILPDSVTTIREGAFSYANIYRLSLPNSLTYIHKKAFGNNPNLVLYVNKNSFGEKFAKAMKIPYDNGSIYNAVVKIDGIRYQYDSNKGTYRIIDTGRELEGSISVPEKVNGKKVTSIDAAAFLGRERLTSVKLPDTITAIGERAFSDCGSLTRINIPKNLKVLEDSVFSGCRLEDLEIPASVTAIKDRAFSQGSFRRAVIPDTVKSLGRWVFTDCINLEEVRLPQKLAEIPESMFAGCKRLKKVTLPKNIKTIKRSAFEGAGLAAVKFPSKLEAIEDNAFADCADLKVSALPKSLKALGDMAFAGCASITEMTIPGTIKEVPDYCFNRCDNLEKVWIEEGVERLGYNVFCDAPRLKELHISDTVIEIDEDALGTAGCVYSTKGSYVEKFCTRKGIPFVAEGAAVLGIPVLKTKVKAGNNITVYQEKRSKNARAFDYVLTKDKNFPKTGKYLYYQKQDSSLKTEFKTLDNGTYYLFARSMREKGEDGSGKWEYSGWSAPKTVKITQSISPCKVRKVSVKGSVVTVTINKASGAKGYGIVLSAQRSKDGLQKLLEPVGIKYASKNNKSTTYVFKNVKPGKYCVLARAYKKGSDGKNVYGKWSGYNKMIKV